MYTTPGIESIFSDGKAQEKEPEETMPRFALLTCGAISLKSKITQGQKNNAEKTEQLRLPT